MDAETGQVLYAKNMNTLRHPASTTKIMTGLLTMENAASDELVTVSNEAVQIPRNTSHIALTQGEVLPVDSVMYGLMLPSGNDAANALAEHIAGSQEAFVARMNQRARELGALNTSFVNAHGLSDDQHLTTAYDLALITRTAIRNADFLRYFGTARHTIPPTNKQKEARPFTNQQYMLLPDMWVYNPEVIGGKTGYTQEARHTMSSAARRGGRTLVAVVLGCGIDEKFYDTQALFDFGFDEFVEMEVPVPAAALEPIPVLEDDQPVGEWSLSLVKDAATVLAPKGVDATAISVRYDRPEAVAGGETPSPTLTVSIPAAKNSGLSAMELEIPILAEFSASTPAISTGKLDEPAAGTGRWYLWLLAVPAGLALWVGMRRQRIRRRAEKRRQRHQRVLEERRRRAG